MTLIKYIIENKIELLRLEMTHALKSLERSKSFLFQ